MVKFVAVYPTPANVDEFDRRFREEHLPMAKSIPNIAGIEVIKLRRLMGERDVFLLVTVSFKDKDAFKVAASTPQWQAWGENAVSIAGKEGIAGFLGQVEVPAGFAGMGALD